MKCYIYEVSHLLSVTFQARANEELYIYEVFTYNPSVPDASRLKIRFKKFHHGLILKEKKTAKFYKRKTTIVEEPTDRKKQTPEGVRLLRQFEDISGYSGVNMLYWFTRICSNNS